MGFSFRLAAVKGKTVGFSYRLSAVKGLRKKKIRSKPDEFERPRKRRRVTVKPDSKSCSFDKIPEELVMEILVRLPAKLVTTLKCVSKLWYSLISSRLFTKFFIESPSASQRRRPLMSFMDKADQRKYLLVSSSLSSSSSSRHDHSDASVSVLDQDLNIQGMGGYFVNALHGLLCVRLRRRVRICNLTTRQRVTLPIIRSRLLAEPNDDNIWNFFGHDTVHDEYKVLSTVWAVGEESQVVKTEHQVLVLGPRTYWRSTHSTILPPPHRPYSQGISINGVLYYGAWVDKDTCVVMSFDLSSEEFNLIELPVEAGIIWHTSRANLINYKGKLAIFEYSQMASDASMHLWVMEDARKGKWSNKTYILPISKMNFAPTDALGMQCTRSCSEVRLAMIKDIPSYKPRRSVIYDLEKKKITRNLEIKPLLPLWFIGVQQKGEQTTFWDDVESIMYLET